MYIYTYKFTLIIVILIIVRGIANSDCSGFVSSIAKYAKLLSDNEEEATEEERSITVKIETNNM